MTCPHQGICGGCSLMMTYEEQLMQKELGFRELFPVLETIPSRHHHVYMPYMQASNYDENLACLDVFHSPSEYFRARAEFRIYRNDDGSLSYAMSERGSKKILPITSCTILLSHINILMPRLLDGINANEILRHKLFGVEFLSGLSGEILTTLLYHRRLDSEWEAHAKALKSTLPSLTSLVGRARGQKIVLGESYIIERLNIGNREWRFVHFEGSFTQPNPHINTRMIEWILSHCGDKDLLELYCGAGNFTIPLALRHKKILATEVSKASINAAKKNCELNDIKNISFVRLNAEETKSALQRERAFNRLAGIDLDEYDFRSVFVDPPRAGLGEMVANFLTRFERILYISCNPKTLHQDLELLTKTHKIMHMAIFDQFPYSYHLESGVILQKIA